MATELSPLDAAHRALGAKMVDFGGWEMPLSYELGTVDEHLACRSSAAIFDVSHLGTVLIEGDDAIDRLQWALTNDLHKISPGRAQYTHLLDEQDASVLDDLIVWWLDDQFYVMPNASNTDRVRAAIGGTEITHRRVVLAVQGPQSKAMLAEVAPGASIGRFRVARLEWNGYPCIIAGTGYTGEDGFEISAPRPAAGDLWEAFVDAGAMPAGLGARDTLRLEAGLPLHGHELGPGITPLQANLGWVVAWNKDEFRGREPLAAERERGVARILRGITTAGRRPPRAECAVFGNGQQVGVTTSGNFSPTLGHGIALALVTPGLVTGTALEVEVRGTRLAGQAADTPFVSAS